MSRILIAVVLLFGALARAQDPPEPAAPGPVAPEPQTQRRTIQLPLTRAIELALQHNLDIEIARTDPLVADELLEQSKGVFDPIGFAAYNFDHSETPIASSVQAAFGSGLQIDEDQSNYETGINGLVPFGLTYSSDYNFQQLESDSGFNALDPEYRPIWVSGVRLPLLRDFINNEASVTVKRRRIGKEISEEGFRATLSNLILQIETQYWNLAATRAEVEVAEKSLQTAQELLEQTQVQYEVGVVSKVLVTQAEAGVAERDFNKIVAANAAGNAQDDLLEAIAAPEPEVYAQTLLVTEDPTFIEYGVDEEMAIERALKTRSELATARDQVEDAELQLAFARNQRLPRLDVTASYTLNGLSGRQKVGPGTPCAGVPSCPDFNGDGFADPIPGIETSRRSAHSDFFNASGAHGWAVGARVEIPIGNRTARHRVFQREIELRRANTNFKRVEQNVIVEVLRAARAMRSAIEGLQASERRRVAQEESLRAEQERLRLGDSTPFQVLEFEQDLVEAELQEITSLRVFRDAIAALEWAQGSLLDARKVSVGEEIIRQPMP
jgi:outer membrane protein TolC